VIVDFYLSLLRFGSVILDLISYPPDVVVVVVVTVMVVVIVVMVVSIVVVIVRVSLALLK